MNKRAFAHASEFLWHFEEEPPKKRKIDTGIGAGKADVKKRKASAIEEAEDGDQGTLKGQRGNLWGCKRWWRIPKGKGN